MTTVVCSWVNYTKEKTILNSTVTRHIPGKKPQTLKYSEDMINESLNDPQVIYLGLPAKESAPKTAQLQAVILGLKHLKESDKNIILLTSQDAKNLIQSESERLLKTERGDLTYIIHGILNNVPNRTYRIYKADYSTIKKFLSNNKLPKQIQHQPQGHAK